MRKLILATAASVVITAASLLPVGGAQAMTPGTASGVHAAIAQTSPIETGAITAGTTGQATTGGIIPVITVDMDPELGFTALGSASESE